MNCEFCNKPTHVWFQCPSKPDGWKPAMLVKKSTAARKEAVQRLGTAERSKVTGPVVSSSRSCALPVDTNSEHRENEGFGAFTSKNVSATTPAGTVGNEDRQPIPKPKFDRVAYQREYMRKRRAEQREYRERKKSEHPKETKRRGS